MVANPYEWSILTGAMKFPWPRSPLRIWSRQTGSTVPSRVSPRLFSAPRLDLIGWCLLTRLSPSSRFPRLRRVHPHHQPPSGQSRFYWVTQLAYRSRSPPRVRWHRARSPQGSLSNGNYPFKEQLLYLGLLYYNRVLIIILH